MTLEGNEIKLGDKFSVPNHTFEYLSANYNSKHNRDMFNEVDKSGVRMMTLKDTEKLTTMIQKVFGGTHIAEESGRCSCTTLVKNKVSNQYNFFFGDRKNHVLFAIESNIFDDFLKKSSYTSNNRLVHAHFNNVWYDGLSKLIIQHNGQTFNKKIGDNKSELCK